MLKNFYREMSFCRLGVAAAVGAMSLTLLAAADRQSVLSDLIRWQDGPIQVVSHNKSITHLVNGALLMNSSEHSFSQVRLGWIVRGLDSGSWQVKGVFSGETIPVPLGPGQLASVPTVEASRRADLDRLMKENPDVGYWIVELGVIRAVGDAWEYNWDLQTQRKFKRTADSSIAEQFAQLVNEGVIREFNEEAEQRARRFWFAMTREETSLIQKVSLSTVPMVLMQSYYSCANTASYIYCTNNVSSCTVTLCGDPDACPKQTCSLMKNIN